MRGTKTKKAAKSASVTLKPYSVNFIKSFLTDPVASRLMHIFKTLIPKSPHSSYTRSILSFCLIPSF